MTADDAPRSLADAAAAWVPPWARKPETPVPDGDVEEGELAASATNDAAEPGDPGAERAEPAEAGAEPEESGAEPPAVGGLGLHSSGEPDVAAVAFGVHSSGEPVVPGPDGVPVADPEQAGTAAADDFAAPVAASAVPGTSLESAPTVADHPLEPAALNQAPRELQLIPDGELRGALEAILLVVEEPVSEILLAQVLEQPTDRITTLLAALTGEYAEADRGFELRRAAGGWRLYTRPRYAPYVEKFVLDGQQSRLTQAALETLAVVAYKQPVTRSRISAIRGVNCDGVVRTLAARGLIQECGSEPDSGAFLYRTTTLFLEKLGLDSVDQLPELAPFLPDDVDEIADAQR